jgi:hypothetical protein
MPEDGVRPVLPTLNLEVYTLTVTGRYPAGPLTAGRGVHSFPLIYALRILKGRSRWGGESGTGAFPW